MLAFWKSVAVDHGGRRLDLSTAHLRVELQPRFVRFGRVIQVERVQSAVSRPDHSSHDDERVVERDARRPSYVAWKGRACMGDQLALSTNVLYVLSKFLQGLFDQ